MIQKMTPEKADKVNAAVDGRIMFDSRGIQAILLTLEPGESMPEHTNPFNVLFAGISGRANLVSDRLQWEISPGATIYVTAEENRGWINPFDEPCRIMVIKLLI